MRCSVRRRVQCALNLIAVIIHDNHIFRLQFVIGNAARLDDKELFLPVNSADIAPGEGDKTVLGKQHIGFIHFFLQFFQHCILLFSKIYFIIQQILTSRDNQ